MARYNHARCQSRGTLFAFERGGKECHVCHACCYAWDVEKTPPRTQAN
jgi:hypothetical protein